MSAQRRGRPESQQKSEHVVSDAPLFETTSSKLIRAAGFLRRAAILRYRRLVGLAWVECAIIGILGRRKP